MPRTTHAARARRAIARASVVAVVLAVLGSGPARAQISGSAVEPDLRVEWRADEDRRGRTLVSGYVYNERPGAYATGVRLRVEALDAAGQAVGSTTAYVMGDVPPSNRSYFEVKAPAKAAAFRVTVQSYTWRGYGAGGG
ncbi:MAG TPA: FxLYD domain-containing protein [Methylomirabilota bacterium]|nr:FxLYD domain-containing protein [Methylomirabilota bacterium]